jgi:hypothetical protein
MGHEVYEISRGAQAIILLEPLAYRLAHAFMKILDNRLLSEN